MGIARREASNSFRLFVLKLLNLLRLLHFVVKRLNDGRDLVIWLKKMEGSTGDEGITPRVKDGRPGLCWLEI